MVTVRPVFLSTYPPEECGLATFTRDSADAVDLAAREDVCSVAAIQKTRSVSDDDPRVVYVIDNHQADAYRRAARAINDGPCDVVSLQHEFGLYPEAWGRRILQFAQACRKPLVTTLHTLLRSPPPEAREVVRALAAESAAIVVMTSIAARLLKEVYDVSGPMVRVIPHGVPAAPFHRDPAAKESVGLAASRPMILTFGLINRGKGLERMIEAMPRVAAECPGALYVIAGATHPVVKRQEGESYRESLKTLAATLRVADNVAFVDRYLGHDELMAYLNACDVFVTPYPGMDQIASGTMAYALATVGAVVSTPYLYAQEALADGRGALVDFADGAGLAAAVSRFLTDDGLRFATRRKAYGYATTMFWPSVGRRYLECFEDVCADRGRVAAARPIPHSPNHPSVSKRLTQKASP